MDWHHLSCVAIPRMVGARVVQPETDQIWVARVDARVMTLAFFVTLALFHDLAVRPRLVVDCDGVQENLSLETSSGVVFNLPDHQRPWARGACRGSRKHYIPFFDAIEEDLAGRPVPCHHDMMPLVQGDFTRWGTYQRISKAVAVAWDGVTYKPVALWFLILSGKRHPRFNGPLGGEGDRVHHEKVRIVVRTKKPTFRAKRLSCGH
mmetsp:Transcript_61986/g.116703  ORF Transcript_61986/g.116703 Transcript_61986/m.116703 type:complete len:206 (+) Transcript_61986:1051-1668(+)